MGSGQSVCELESEGSGSVAKIGQDIGCTVSSTFGQIQGQFIRQTRSYKAIAGLSYDELQDYIKELNSISGQFLDSNGKQLVFAVKKGSDVTPFWKGTVRIACVKVDSSTSNVDSYRLLTLKQFLAVFRSLQAQAGALHKKGEPEAEEETEGQEQGALQDIPTLKKEAQTDVKFSASMFMNDALDNAASLEECCVCLERKPDVILPCAHSYCLPCIEQWNVNHKTCPVCRDTLESTEDGWVISEGPDSIDIETEIQKALMELAQD